MNLPKKIIIFLFITCGLVFISPAKAWAATLSVSAASGSVSGTFTIDVNVDTAAANVTGVDAILNYEPSKLEATQITEGAFSSYPKREIDSTNGKIRISATASADSPFSGSGKVATITFRALATSGTTTLTFDYTSGSTTDSNVVEHQTVQDVLTGVTNGSYTLAAAAASPTPTPTSAVPETGSLSLTIFTLLAGTAFLGVGLLAFLFI